MNNQSILLHIKGVTKAFSGVKALEDMQLDVRQGSVHALMGENGAGKSTLMKILTGLYTRDAGEIIFDGKPLDTSSINNVIHQGISMIYQEINPIANMTVAENIFCGKELCKINHILIDKGEMQSQAQKLLDDMGHSSIKATQKVATLSVAQMQVMEIAKAISNKSKLIIMDEPTSAITEKEVQQLFETIRTLQKQGITFIYISHKMDEIFQIADEVTVMRDGRYVGTRSTKETNTDELVSMMVGRQLSEYYPKEPVEMGSPLLEIEHLNIKELLHDISLTVRHGEILGLAGLMGPAVRKLWKPIMGIRKADSGTIKIHGKPIEITGSSSAIKTVWLFLPRTGRKAAAFWEQVYITIS